MASYKLKMLSSMVVYRGPLFCHAKANSRLLSHVAIRAFSSSSKSSSRFTWKTFAKGLGVGVLIGGGYTLYSTLQTQEDAHKQFDETTVHIVDKVPDVPIARKIVNPKDKTNLDLILFQYQTCPFCCKVRAFLDSNGLSYSIVEVDAVLRQSLKWSTYKKVPLVLARTKDGKYVQLSDSSMIVSTLATYLLDPKADIAELVKLYPRISYTDDQGHHKHDIINKYYVMYEKNVPKGLTKEVLQEERKWREWVDHHFVHLISPNVYRSIHEALATFEWFSKAGEWDVNFPRWERNLMVYFGAFAMWLISMRLKRKHELGEDVRQDFYVACREWVSTLEKQKTKFLGGETPNLADLSLYGAINSFEGCGAFADICHHTKIGSWYNAVKEYIDANKGKRAV